MNIFAIDIGGSSIKVGIIQENGLIIKTDRIMIPSSFDQMIEDIVSCYKKYSKIDSLSGIAISAPGSVDPVLGIIGGASAIPYIHGPNWIEILKDKTGVSVAIENDANCAALAEAHFGVHKHAESMAFVVIGSGIGGSNVYKGEIISGAHAHGGEYGYMILNSDEEGIHSFSELGSIGGLVTQAKAKGLDVESGHDVFNLYHEGNQIAQACIESFYKYLGIGIFNVQYVYDPEVILLSGAISEMEGFNDKVMAAVQRVYDMHGSARLLPKVEIATFGKDSNLVGALVNYKMRVRD